ncbi:MAG: hypothetical protein K0R51_2962, partial [Cytophagaceae bacterium]|nr:hypothetical protein [Cytophagaceae bacterium]
MNRILLSLVSYFVCLLFFVSASEGATFTVISNSDNQSPTNIGALGWAIDQANTTPGGPHTILLQADGRTWGTGLTLSAPNVTIMSAPSACNATYTINMGGANLSVTGGGCVFSSVIFRGTCLLLNSANNRVWGCWFNTDATGLASQGVGTNNGSMIYINNGANNTIGMTGQCRNVFSGASTTDMIRIDGTSTGTIISNNYMGVAKNGTTVLGTSSQNGINFLSGSMANSRIDSNIIVATNSDVIKIAGAFTSSFIRNNNIRQGTSHGISVSGDFSSGLISNNTLTTIGGAGIIVTGASTGLTITNNSLSATAANGISISAAFNTGTISNNTITNVANGNGIILTGASTGITLANNDISNISLNGIKIEGALTINNISITNNKIRQVLSGGDATAEEDGFGIKLKYFTSNSVLIQGNLIGVQADGHVNTGTDLGCPKNGIYARASIATLTINDNVVCDNGNLSGDREMYSGMFIKAEGEFFGSIAVTNNYIGVDKFGGAKGNDFAGINIRYTSGGMTSVNVTGNIVGDNGFNGGSTKKSHGIAFEGFKPASSANFVVNSNYVGVYPTTYANIGNYGNGIEMNNCTNFRIGGAGLGNTVGYNKMATTFDDYDGGGIVLTGCTNANATIQGNAVGQSLDGLHNFGNTNADPHIIPIANHFAAGISILNSSNVTIGGTAANLANVVKNNTYGIAIAGAASTGNVLYRNTVASNTNFGIYISGSANTVGDVASFANANIVNDNGRDGIHVYGTTAVNNRISRNQIFCNTLQGIKLNYGANQGNNGLQPPVITSVSGNTVSGTVANAGATIEIFRDDDPGCPTLACGTSTSDNRREGKTYLATVTATGTNWTYTHGSAIDENNVSATATVGTNTSEFSTCNIVTICPPDANAGADKSICNATTTTLTSNKTAVELAGGTATWTQNATSGTGTIAAPFTGSPVDVSGLTVGQSSTFELTVSKPGCPNTTDYVTVTVNSPVTAVATVPANACQGTSFVLDGTSTGTGTYQWSSVPSTGVVITNATSLDASAV